jgi:hypothetical protein
VEPTEDEFQRGHKYPFISCELLNCDVTKLLDFFTLTESQRKDRDRKTSSVDSDFGISDSINSNSDNNTWFEKRDDLYKKGNIEENSDNKANKMDSAAEEEKEPDSLAVAANEQETEKLGEMTACEVINPKSAAASEDKEADVHGKNEGLYIFFLFETNFILFIFEK